MNEANAIRDSLFQRFESNWSHPAKRMTRTTPHFRKKTFSPANV